MSAPPYTARTLAERLACSERHIRELIRRGELRGFRLGGKLWRIRAEEVERWEREQEAIASGGSRAGSSSPGLSAASDAAFASRQG